MKKVAAVLLYIALSGALLTSLCAPIASAAPRGQSTPAATTSTPTDEPPKSPYVFPTPIFIPTYPGDTPVATSVSRSAGQPTGQDTYTVQSGDSPWTIAQKVYGNGSKYPLIMSANNLTDSTRLRVGMILKIPQVAGSAPAAAPTATPPASEPVAPVPQPTTATIISPIPAMSPTRSPASSGILPGSVADAANLAINVVSGILLLGALTAAVFAFLVYYRARRMEGMNTRKKRIQFLQ
jgi:LysM repeat protein